MQLVPGTPWTQKLVRELVRPQEAHVHGEGPAKGPDVVA